MKLPRPRHLLALSPWPLALVIAFFLLPPTPALLPAVALAQAGAAATMI